MHLSSSSFFKQEMTAHKQVFRITNSLQTDALFAGYLSPICLLLSTSTGDQRTPATLYKRSSADKQSKDSLLSADS